MLAALDLLAGLPGRRIAVLGEMLELGPESEAGHRQVGRAAGRVADLLVVVGEDAEADRRWAPSRPVSSRTGILIVDDAEGAHDVLRPRLVPGDVVLVKASRGSPWSASWRPSGRRARTMKIGTVELIQGLLLSFIIIVILMPPFIRLLRDVRFGKSIREEGPASAPGQARHADRAAGSC